jgi:hypothetical protein
MASNAPVPPPSGDVTKSTESEPTPPQQANTRGQVKSTSGYWTLSSGRAIRSGWSCRECHRLIAFNDPIIARDGRRLRLMYHASCYSGDPDPRSQLGGSYWEDKWARTTKPSEYQPPNVADGDSTRAGSGRGKSNLIAEQAPPVKGHGKWSVLQYGYMPNGRYTLGVPKSHSENLPENHAKQSRDFSRDAAFMTPITWGFSRKERPPRAHEK